MSGLGDDDDYNDILEESPKLSTTSPRKATTTRRSRPLIFMKTIFGECLCEHFPVDNSCNGTSIGARACLSKTIFSSQYVELRGIQFIGLGCLEDELTAKERVYDTLEQLSSRTDRLISIGYISVEPSPVSQFSSSTSPLLTSVTASTSLLSPSKVVTTTVPLDVWNNNFPNDRTTSKVVKRIIANIQTKKFSAALVDLQYSYKEQKQKFDLMKKNATKNDTNKKKKDCYELYMLGITIHNIGVVQVLDGHGDKSVHLFEEAVEVKSETLGPGHPEVAISLDELGIQLFALERYDEALITFQKSQTILANFYGQGHPQLSMVLNNIACCIFQMRNIQEALSTMKYAIELQKATKSITKDSKNEADLDLLHRAILLNNIGYLKVNVKQYEEARSNFEEALLIQQSVLGDAHNHRAIRDSRNNLEFTNAFHSD